MAQWDNRPTVLVFDACSLSKLCGYVRMYNKALLLLELKGTDPKAKVALLNNMCTLHRESNELKEARDCLM